MVDTGKALDIPAQCTSPLEESARRLEKLFQTSPTFMCILTGPEFVFERANQKCLELIVQSDVVGKRLLDVLPEFKTQGFLDFLRSVIATGEPYTASEVRVVLKRKQGSESETRYLDFVFQPDIKSDEKRVFVHGNDVTEKVVARKMMETAKAQIENERENFRNLFKQTPEMVCILSGADHVFEFVNDAHIRALGFDATGKPVRVAQPESVEVHGILDNVYRTGITAELHEIPVTLTDRLRYFNLTYSARRDSSGKISGVMILGAEVTNEVVSRVELRETQARYRALFDLSPLPKWIYDKGTLQFLDVNETALLFYGMSRAEFLKLKVTDLIAPGSLEKFYRSLERGFSQGHVRLSSGLKHLHRKGKGPEINVEVTSIDIVFSGKAAIYEAVMDVTDRLRSQNEQQELMTIMENAKIEAERANESKTRFLANMSHEIRTPLAAILGFSELLQNKIRKEDVESATHLDRISRNASQLGRLIDELLDLSKIEADKFEIERTDFDLFAVIEDAISSVSLRAREKGLIFEQHFIGVVPRHINTDRARLVQLLTNILGNAVKFTESGRIDVEFEYMRHQEKSFLRIRVKDTGIGLAKEHQAKIFEPFVQADASVTRKYGGTGLGLVLSKRFAQLLGGDLNLEASEPGKGSSFLATIEIKEVAPQIKSVKDVVTARPHDGVLAGKRILIVDDSPDNQTIIRLYLESTRADLEIASNGREATDMIRKTQFDLVLMDIQMPVMDGYQALKVARNEGFLNPIVALTAHAMKEEKQRCLSSGFTDYLSKPVNRSTLISRIADLTNS